MNTKFFVAIVAAALVAALPAPVLAQSSSTTVTDDFTGAAASNDWQPFNGACLTAGSGSGTVPGCIGLNYYNGQNLVGGNLGYLGASSPPSIADPVGKGALLVHVATAPLLVTGLVAARATADGCQAEPFQ